MSLSPLSRAFMLTLGAGLALAGVALLAGRIAEAHGGNDDVPATTPIPRPPQRLRLRAGTAAATTTRVTSGTSSPQATRSPQATQTTQPHRHGA